MSENLGTRRPPWFARLCYVTIAMLVIGFVAFAIYAVSDRSTPMRGSAGPLAPVDQGPSQPPTAPAPRQTR